MRTALLFVCLALATQAKATTVTQATAAVGVGAAAAAVMEMHLGYEHPELTGFKHRLALVTFSLLVGAGYEAARAKIDGQDFDAANLYAGSLGTIGYTFKYDF